ncbi:MAG: DNA polymerase I [Nitrospinae bacterium]|nr:DNA polymerase I [Nitrospinota bacterium]
MADKPTLYLIDGAGYYYRAYFAIRQYLSNSKGTPTNAIYGFALMLNKILGDLQPTHAVMVFDSKEKTFRHEMYEDYKAHRPEMPPDLAEQIPWIDRLVAARNLPALRLAGYEADDLIGTLAHRAVKEGFDVVIVTSDKDMMQLVGPGVRIFDSMKDRWIGPEEVRERFGAPPEKVVDVLGLMGDTSDNIPGVPGVGEKTAIALVTEYGGLEEAIAAAPLMTKKKLRESLMEFAEQARLSRQLATIARDAPVDFASEAWRLHEPDYDKLRELYTELEFHTLAARLAPPPPKVARQYQTVLTDEAFEAMIQSLDTPDGFAFDTETTSTDPMRARLVGMSFCRAPGVAYYLPLRHDYLGAPAQLALETVLPPIRRLLEDERIPKAGHNIKYDALVMAGEGVAVRGPMFDTMIASYLINPSARHALSAVAREWLNEPMIEYEEVCGSGVKQITFDKVEVARATEYSAEDADMTWRLRGKLRERMESDGLTRLFEEIETPLIEVLGAMERHAPKQLGEILFEKLKLKGGRKTKTGYSTDQGALEDLAADHPLPALALEYRQLAKLKGTYVDALPRMINPATGRIHTSFNQTITATGRLSSSDPNLQNIPIRGELGRAIRRAFIAPPGWRIVSADYSQVELRILASLAEETALLEAFKRGEDIHTRTAAEVFHVDARLVTPEMRRVAKSVNFGVVYGQTAFGLAGGLGIPRAEAQRYIDNYFRMYPRVKAYIEQTIAQARKDGYVTTLAGRRRYLPDINAKNRQARQFAERNAVNSPIQGSAADLIKIAMIALSRALGAGGWAARMILQVHDELVFEAPEEAVERLTALVRREMEGALTLSAPLTVDIRSGANWDEAH